MNIRLIIHLLSSIMLVEGAAMAPSLILALIYQDGDAAALAVSMAVTLALSVPGRLLSKPTERQLRAKEGYLVVSLAWIALSLFGALPFLFSGLLPNFFDAVFESVSGFTTTGATVLTAFEGAPRGIMFWRSFTHWIGGMGVLVLTLALLPQMSGRTSHLVRAESPGPSLSKIVPKLGDSAKILYLIYGILTLIQFLLLMLAGMNAYDAAIHAMGTAGTGGFSNYGSSIAAFNNPAIDVIITFFMVLFGINFAIFYRVLTGSWREAVKSEELHWYLSIFAGATLLITLLLLPKYGSVLESQRYAGFQVASIISTTGYATADYNLWPVATKMLIFILMFIGSCAGSTAGGLKVSRIVIALKGAFINVRKLINPRYVPKAKFEGKSLEQQTINDVFGFITLYFFLLLVAVFILSFDPANGQAVSIASDMGTNTVTHGFFSNFSSALACISNIGPAFEAIGPYASYADYSAVSKITLALMMLIGRLEIFPVLILFSRRTWKRI